jgi:hypothetical protein
MALQRTRRLRFRSGRSLRSLGSPLNAQPLGRVRLRSSLLASSTAKPIIVSKTLLKVLED